MVGRDLRDVETWSMVPPAASLTLAWGEGGCTVVHEGGTLAVAPGEWMWLDAGVAHRGENLPGSDFLTLFVPDAYVRRAALDVAPIGAASGRAPDEHATLLKHLAVRLLDGSWDGGFAAPALDAILDRVGTDFPPGLGSKFDELVETAAARMRADHADGTPIAQIAREVGLGGSEFSRRFSARFEMAPVLYRRQLRLIAATHALAQGRAVAAAAREAGFSDAAHLTRTFRAQYGIAPSDWARRVA